jgi:hypothetical protein
MHTIYFETMGIWPGFGPDPGQTSTDRPDPDLLVKCTSQCSTSYVISIFTETCTILKYYRYCPDKKTHE